MSRDSNVLNLSLNPIHEHSASPVHGSPGSSHWEHDQYTNLPTPAGRRNERKLERQSHVSSMDAVMGDSIYAILKSDKHLCEEERKITSQDTNLSQRRGQNTPTRLDTSGMPLQQSELDLIFGPSPTSPASNRISPNAGPGRRGVFSANYRNNSFAKSQIKSPIDGKISGLLNSSFNTASDVLSSRRKTFDGGASNQKQSHSFDDLQSLNRTRRRTIAPLDSLDSSIQKRKNRSHSKLPELLDKEIIEEDEIETPGRSSESEVSIPSQKSNLEKVQSLPESVASSRRLQSTDSSLDENDKTREMKTAFKKVKERFIHNQQQQHATSTNNDHRRRRINSVKNDLNGRKPSEGFKSRILRRAKSVITRQPKKSLDDSKELPSPIMPKHRSMFYEKGDSFEEVATSNTASPLSNRPNSMQFPYPFADNTESKLNSSTVSEVLMQGDLYRKKLGHWVNSWAVLTADKVFTLYKTKEFYEELKYFTRESSCDNIPTMIDSPESKSGIILSINLKDGCEVENINQGKTKVTFSLVPHTYRSLPPHLDNNLSYEAGLWWDKPVQLMSKNNSEFLYWIKAFVQLNKREGSTPQQSQFQGNGHAVLLRRELSNQSNNSENDHPTSKVLNPNRTVDSNLSYKNPMKMNQVALKAKKDDLPFIDDSLMPMRTHKKVHRHKLKVKTKTSFEEKRSDSENDFKSLELSTSPGIKSAEIIFASHGYPCCESSKNSLSSEDGGLILVTPNHATCTCKNHSNGSLKHEVGEKSKPNKDIERNNKLAVNGENMTEHKETSREKQDAEFVNNKETNKGCGNVTTQGVSPISSTNKPPDTFSLGEKPPIHKTNSDNVDATKTNNSVADRKTLIANKQIVAPKISIDLDDSSPVYSSASSGSEDEDDVLNRRGPRSFLSVKEGRTGGTNVKKQQSLRQRVLRKLKAKNSLSSSTPNLNVQKGNSEPRVDLKVVEPETSASTPASPVVVRRQKKSHIKVPKIEKIEVHRSRSEGDIFKAVTNAKHPSTKRADMRTFRNSRQLSRDNFIETFGVISKKRIEYQRNTRQSMFEVDRFVHYSQNDVSDIINGSDRYSSQIETSSESAGSMSSSNDGVSTHSYGRTVVSESQSPISKTFKAAMTPSRKTKSTGSDASNERDPIKENHRTSWLSSLTPHFPKRSTSKASTSTPGAVGRRAVYQIPATQLAASSHRGYLDRRNKKKQWERFWCVLQDSCLYFYNAPQSELTQDAIVLRGYDVIADVTNMNRSRFSFRLERNGSPTLHFSSDNHENFLLWVGTLVKETSIVSSNISNNEILARSAQSVPNIVQEQTETPKLANIVEDSKKQDFTYKPVSDEEIKKQKEALLREVLLVQQKIIDEQNATLDDATNKPPHPRSSKVFVHEKYDREKQVGEVKNLKMMTHLNRRRNSAQLKLDQISKQLAPKTGRKRREDPRQYADMEKRLKYLQDRLRQVDLEIQEEQEKKKQDLEKLQQKMDLELLVLEQKENLEIIKRHHQRRQMEARDKENHNSSSLTAIEEANVVSDTSSNSEDAASVDRTSSGHGKFTTTPITSFQSNSVGGDSASSTSYDSLHHKSSDENFSYVNRLNSASSNDDVFGTDTNASISQDICNNNNIVKYPKAEEINPSVLAEIDDFIEFSKEKRKALS